MAEKSKPRADVSARKRLVQAAAHARRVLDEEKRRLVVAMVSQGGSLRMAARMVGCSPGTLIGTAARDPEFARRCAEALLGMISR